MLYGNQSISHFSKSNTAIWMAMAFQAGVLNICGFLAGHRIVSHVTGFATFFGDEINKENGNAWGMLVIPVFFLVGAMISGYFVDIRLKLNKKPKYYLTFGMMFFLITALWLLSIFGYWGEFGSKTESLENYGMLIMLCLVCGIQNGTISTVSRSIVRTTHLTGITTDLGLGLVRILNRKKIEDKIKYEGSANLMRIGIIASFVLGSVVGGYLFKHWKFNGLLLPVIISGMLFWLMVYFQIWKRELPE